MYHIHVYKSKYVHLLCVTCNFSEPTMNIFLVSLFSTLLALSHAYRGKPKQMYLTL